jgi:hypothetical protein
MMSYLTDSPNQPLLSIVSRCGSVAERRPTNSRCEAGLLRARRVAQNKAKASCEDSQEDARFAEVIDWSFILEAGGPRRTNPSEAA